ncbi:FkbM family methyltransferase [Lentzea sp. NPDC004789]
MFATTPYEAEIVLAELASGSGYLHGMGRLPERPVVIDVGAHIGLFSLDVLRRHPDAKVIAVEPFAPSYAALARNLALYQNRAEPLAVHAAVGDRPGRTEILGCRGGSMLASTRDGDDLRTLEQTRATLARSVPRVLGRGPWGREVADGAARDALDGLFAPARASVPQVTVSELVEAHALRRVSLLKVDVEGDEARVLAGVDSAHWPLIDAVVVETDRSALAQVCAILSRHGLVPTVSEPAFTSTAFARDCRIVRARRGAVPAATPRPEPVPAAARYGPAVAEIAALLDQLHQLGRRIWPEGHLLVDARADPHAAPLSEPWLERGFRLGLSHGRAWARHLFAEYPLPVGSDTDLPSALTRVVGGDWRSAAGLLGRYPVADVVAARMAALHLIHRAVRLTFDPGGGVDVRTRADD